MLTKEDTEKGVVDLRKLLPTVVAEIERQERERCVKVLKAKAKDAMELAASENVVNRNIFVVMSGNFTKAAEAIQDAK